MMFFEGKFLTKTGAEMASITAGIGALLAVFSFVPDVAAPVSWTGAALGILLLILAIVTWRGSRILLVLDPNKGELSLHKTTSKGAYRQLKPPLRYDYGWHREAIRSNNRTRYVYVLTLVFFDEHGPTLALEEQRSAPPADWPSKKQVPAVRDFLTAAGGEGVLERLLACLPPQVEVQDAGTA